MYLQQVININIRYLINFEVTDQVVEDFQKYLNARRQTSIVFITYKEEVKQYIKAALADQLFGFGAFEEVLNQRDTMVKEVINLSLNKEFTD